MNSRNGIVIEIGAAVVRKTYPGAKGRARVTHLKTIYELLAEKSVPNMDSLYLAKLDDPSCGIVYFQPRGLNVYPRFAHDVVDAIVCILEALVVRIRFIHFEVSLAYIPRRLCMPIQTLCSTETSAGQI
jgi:hypothetical protein